MAARVQNKLLRARPPGAPAGDVAPSKLRKQPVIDARGAAAARPCSPWGFRDWFRGSRLGRKHSLTELCHWGYVTELCHWYAFAARFCHECFEYADFALDRI